MESLYTVWGKRSPEWETRYQESIMNIFSDYGKGTTPYQESRGKTFGAGYEVFILAFFIGLYSNKTIPLTEDKTKRKSCGQPIQYWGNQEHRFGRSAYGQIREYLFAALVARTDIDFIALDKGEITERKVVDLLIDKMEQYANFGFSFMLEKLEENPNFFSGESAFLKLFLSFAATPDDEAVNAIDDELETLT